MNSVGFAIIYSRQQQQHNKEATWNEGGVVYYLAGKRFKTLVNYSNYSVPYVGLNISLRAVLIAIPNILIQEY